MKNKTALIYIICCAALMAALIGAGLIFSKKTMIESKNIKETKITTIQEFQIDAFKFGYSPDNIKVKKGDKVKIIINNIDTLHGIRIPELGISNDNVLELVAEKSGEFDWYCNNYCGLGHSQMKGKLIVE